MALSNTAVPIYYGEWREAVLAGEIPVNEYISLEMNRIDALIENPFFYYDPAPVEGFIAFCEDELTLTDGADWYLLDSFKVWAEQVYGWYYFKTVSVYQPGQNGERGRYVNKKRKVRLTKKQFLIVGRGAAKSLYGSAHQGYGLTIDDSTTHQITTAPTMKQSEEILSPLRTAITRAKGPFFKFLTTGSTNASNGSLKDRVKLTPTKKGIENRLTGSLLEIRAMSISKVQGLRVKYATVDEWLSGDIREDVIGPIEQGASKLDDYLIICMSSEGTVRNGSGDDIKMELISILRGEYYAPHVSIFYYRMDSVEEIAFPELWVKANPNVGKTVSFETIQLDVERAEKVPSARNDILAKRFGIPMEGYTFFFRYEETVCHPRRDFWGMPCALGADLSQGNDFCSFAFLFPLPREEFGVKTRNYISRSTLDRLPPAMRHKYNQFINEGTLIVMECVILDMMDIYDDLQQHIEECDYDIRCFGFDPYNAKEFVNRYIAENGEYGVEKVIQGEKSESVPLGEIKKLAEERLLLFDEEILSFTMGHCITIENTNGGRKLLKRKYSEKIDSVAATMDAYIAYKSNRDDFN